MTNFSNSGGPILFYTDSLGDYGFFEDDYIENAILVRKGREMKYTNKLALVTSLDLSDNVISGDIPEKLTSLICLQSLNLSNNRLVGKIPSRIGDMKWTDSGKLQSFDPSSFPGNKLCGPPLEECSTNHVGSSGSSGNKKEGAIVHLLEDGWFDMSLGLGFAFGFWGILGSLLLNMPWSTRFCRFQNNIVNKLYAIIQEKVIRRPAEEKCNAITNLAPSMFAKALCYYC
ncbi:unnamed protein product [Malus baccata var. baccata]